MTSPAPRSNSSKQKRPAARGLRDLANAVTVWTGEGDCVFVRVLGMTLARFAAGTPEARKLLAYRDMRRAITACADATSEGD